MGLTGAGGVQGKAAVCWERSSAGDQESSLLWSIMMLSRNNREQISISFEFLSMLDKVILSYELSPSIQQLKPVLLRTYTIP